MPKRCLDDVFKVQKKVEGAIGCLLQKNWKLLCHTFHLSEAILLMGAFGSYVFQLSLFAIHYVGSRLGNLLYQGSRLSLKNVDTPEVDQVIIQFFLLQRRKLLIRHVLNIKILSQNYLVLNATHNRWCVLKVHSKVQNKHTVRSAQIHLVLVQVLVHL